MRDVLEGGEVGGEGLAAQIVAVQLDQVEGIQDDVAITATGMQLVEPRRGLNL